MTAAAFVVGVELEAVSVWACWLTSQTGQLRLALRKEPPKAGVFPVEVLLAVGPRPPWLTSNHEFPNRCTVALFLPAKEVAPHLSPLTRLPRSSSRSTRTSFPSVLPSWPWIRPSP